MEQEGMDVETAVAELQDFVDRGAWSYAPHVAALISEINRLNARCNELEEQARQASELRHALLGDDPDMPREILPISWLRSMLDACQTDEAASTLGGDDPDSWCEMCCEVRPLLERAERALGLTPRPGTELDPEEDGPEASERRCPGHEWAYTGTAYGGDDSSYHGEGRCYCVHCGADGDA